MAGVKLGVMGGTFDPVHLGHIALAQAAQAQLSLGRTLWVPSGEPWRKAHIEISPAEQRLAMVELAIAGIPEFELSRLEIDRAGPSYSVETLSCLAAEEADSELYLLLGRDALEDLPNWREPGRLLKLATLGVATRGRKRLTSKELDDLLPGLSGSVVWVDMPHVDISATELRSRVADRMSLRGLVPASVEAYILEQKLYQAG